MAIKINGTTVIDDSRNLVNIASGAGSSTTAGDVGTYTYGRPANATDYNVGDTATGILPVSEDSFSNNARYSAYGYWNAGHRGTAFSGTWRCMSDAYNSESSGSDAFCGLWVRIS